MPTYEYECPHCGHTFEASQKITDKPLDKCPKCNKKVKRLISSGIGVIFSHQAHPIRRRDPAFDSTCLAGKGSGFYATDYRKKKGAEKHNAPPPTCPKFKKGCNACEQK